MKIPQKLHSLTRLCLCCLAAWAFAACHGSSDEVGEELMDEGGTYYQISIHTRDGRYTRANGPQGGDSGDGELGALHNEAKAYNATVLLYASANGINASDAEAERIRIQYAFYAPDLVETSPGIYTSSLLHDQVYFQQGATFHLLILVNMGDRHDLVGKTLKEVRDLTSLYDQTKAGYEGNTMVGLPWSGNDMNVANYDRFVMTSTQDLSITFPALDGPEHPVTFTANVSRLAARIDFSPGTTTGGSPLTTYRDGPKVITLTNGTNVTMNAYYEYDVKDSEGNKTGDQYYLVGWCPFNLKQDEAYLFRRVSDYNDGTHLTYLGEEKTVNIGSAGTPLYQASNYVLDPTTPQKTSSAGTSLTNTKGAYGLTTIYNKFYDGTEATIPPDAEFQIKKEGAGLDMDGGDGRNYHTLAYAMENTLRSDSPKERYATGILLKGYYAKKVGDTYTYTAKNYVYYIRHSDPSNSNSDALVMKYGIVRNNVYRVFINSISPTGLIMIETVNWYYVESDPIYM